MVVESNTICIRMSMKFTIVKDSNKSNKQEEAKTLVEQPKWTLEEVALSKSTLDQIDQMVAYIKNREKLLKDWESVEDKLWADLMY